MRSTRANAVLFLLPLLMSGLACKREPDHTNMNAVTQALLLGDPNTRAAALQAAPSCSGDAGSRAPAPCLGPIATWVGSKTGFHSDPPDEASAEAAAVVIARDGHGEWIPASDGWLSGVTNAPGHGADMLRLAMALRIAEGAGPLGRALSTDDDARALMRAVATSVPGACDTYARLGAGEDVSAGRPEGRADHSPCVQKDLERPTGPAERGRYGSGLWRGAEGALAHWKEAVAALRQGVSHTEGHVRGTLEPRVAEAEAALAKLTTKKVATAPDYVSTMGNAHGDAGVPFSGAAGVPQGLGGVPR